MPREPFIPDIGLIGPVLDDPASWIDRRQDPDRWQAMVRSDLAIGTQLDDGTVDLTATTKADPAAMATSSCSAPRLVAEMLTLLDAAPDHRVLEIGTGTGWTAALLARQVGQGNVVTIEIDEAVAARATANLESAGYAPRVVVGDGAHGWPDAAPYDRVHVTAGAATVPYAWVEQTRRGGVIVLPWMPGWDGAGHLLNLTVQDGAARGRMAGQCGFMLLRDQRPTVKPLTGEARESTTGFDLGVFFAEQGGLALAVAGLLPGVSGSAGQHADGTLRVAARSATSHALAVRSPGTGETLVRQRGPRNLWNELQEAFRWWKQHNCPSPERYGATVTRDGLHLWLDDPKNPVRSV